MVHRYNKDTQSRILKEANRLFMSKGYQATSTREIAKNAGVTQPNLYHYFGDKEKLYTAVLEEHLLTVGKDLRAILDENKTDFQKALIQMTNYLVQTHLLDLFMMLHDLKLHLSSDLQTHLFYLWKKSYREPFEIVFSMNQAALRNHITTEMAAKHFFLLLAPYITESTSSLENPFSVEQFIDLYLNGVLK